MRKNTGTFSFGTWIASKNLIHRTINFFLKFQNLLVLPNRELSQQCQTIATGILDSCIGDKEVKSLLTEKAGARKFFKCVQWYKYPKFQVAVELEHKEFVTHPYCQQVVMKDFQGNMNWHDLSFAKKCFYVCVVVLLMPLHILIHIICRSPRNFAKLVHGSEEGHMFQKVEKQDLNGTEKVIKFLDNTRVVLDIPFNRFLSFTFMYQLFIGGLITTATTPVSTTNPINYNHIFIFFFSFGHTVNDIQILLNSSWKTFATFWRLYHSFSHLLLNIAFTLKVLNFLVYCETESGDELELACHICYAIATIDSLVGTLYWFQLHSKMGPIIIQGGNSNYSKYLP